MAGKKRAVVEAVKAAGPAGPGEVVKPAEAALPVVERVHLVCPYPGCKSVRSLMVFSKPGHDGRMERRRCRSCCREFDVWDPDRKS